MRVLGLIAIFGFTVVGLGCGHKGIACGIAAVPVEIRALDQATGRPLPGATVRDINVIPPRGEREYLEGKARGEQPVVTDRKGVARGTKLAGFALAMGWPPRSQYRISESDTVTVSHPGYRAVTTRISDQTSFVRYGLFGEPSAPKLRRTVRLTRLAGESQ